jgi:hypothetical protein
VVVVDALEKVHPDRAPRPRDAAIGQTVLLGETASFQVAMRAPIRAGLGLIPEVSVAVEGAGARFARLSTVELVPVSFPAFPEHDDGYERDDVGLYPDLLRPTDGRAVHPLLGRWSAVWIDLRVDDARDAGVLPLEVVIRDGDEEVFRETVVITVVAHPLPPLAISTTHWFHADALADHYGVEVLGEEHWRLIDAFLAAAAELDATTVLTPVWTPPLDTAVGLERTPVQLVEIAGDGDRYRFEFARLRRWMELCRRHGFRDLEIAHLFSQWGAGSCPVFLIERDGTTRSEFGWGTAAGDPRYRALLEQLLPALREELGRAWDPDAVVWHISDEPHGAEAVAGYLAARSVVDDLLAGCRIADAVGDLDLIRSGVIPTPVVATDLFDDVADELPADRWVYYCQSQHRDVANRFIAMPSVRNRVIGVQLWAARVTGFLHWGFDFYSTWGSVGRVDPMRDTCAGGQMPGGDAFIVYPGEDGRPLASIRYRVFAQAMADLRALQALEQLEGRAAVRDLVDPAGTLTFRRWDRDPEQHLRMRERVTGRLARALDAVDK